MCVCVSCFEISISVATLNRQPTCLRPLNNTGLTPVPIALLQQHSSHLTTQITLFFPVKHQGSKKKLGESGGSLHLSSLLKRATEVKMCLFRAEEDVVLMAEMFAIWILRTCCLETAVKWAPCFRCCLACQQLKFTHSLISLQFLLTQLNLWQFSLEIEEAKRSSSFSAKTFALWQISRRGR